jgi:hypothetical protein
MMSGGNLEAEPIGAAPAINEECSLGLIENNYNSYTYTNEYIFNETQTDFAILPNNFVQNEVVIDYAEEPHNEEPRPAKNSGKLAKSVDCSPVNLVALDSSPNQKHDSYFRRSFASKNSNVSLKRMSLNPYTVNNANKESLKKYELRNSQSKFEQNYGLKQCDVKLYRLDAKTIQHYTRKTEILVAPVVAAAAAPKTKPRPASKRAKSSQAVAKKRSKSELKENDDQIKSMFNLKLNGRVFALNSKQDYVPAIITEMKSSKENGVLFKCNFLDMEKGSKETDKDNDQVDDDYEYEAENYDYLSARSLIPANILEEGDRLTVYRKFSYKPGYFETYGYQQNAMTDESVEMFCVKLSSRNESIRFSFRHVSIKNQDSIHIKKRVLGQLEGLDVKADKKPQTAKKTKNASTNSLDSSPKRSVRNQRKLSKPNESGSDEVVEYEGTSANYGNNSNRSKTNLNWDRNKESISSGSTTFSLNTVRAVDTTKAHKLQSFTTESSAKKVLKLPNNGKKKELFVEKDRDESGKEVIKTFKRKISQSVAKKSSNH